ncbi:MAG: hypothetical protein ACK515_24440 [bacterium]|jgi:hypothetical protein
MSMPVHDPARDGNVFHWILETAKRIREERQGVADYVRFRQGLIKNANAARLRAEPLRARSPATTSAKP